MISMAMAMASAPAGPAPLARLVGHCWRGVLPGGNADTHCFARHGQTVIDRHVVRHAGRAVYRGETRYEGSAGAWHFAYRNADGPVMAGTVTVVPGGLRYAVDGGPVLDWRWEGTRAYLAPAGPSAVSVRFRRLR